MAVAPFTHAAQACAAPAAQRRHAGLTRAGAAFRALHGLTVIAALVQAAVDHGHVNLACVLLVAASSTLTFGYVRATRAMRELPLSTFALMGLCITTQWGALVGQSALLGSLTEHLRVPLQTFSYLLAFQAMAVAAHALSRRVAVFGALRRAGAGTVARLGVFHLPPVQALWAMGLLGVAALGFAQGREGATLLTKVADGFVVLAWSPFVIPLLHLRHGRRYCRMAVQWPALIAFALAVIGVGLFLNFRSVMLVGVFTAALLFGMQLLDDERPYTPGLLRGALAAALVLALLYQPLTYFLTGVQVAREQRGKIDRWAMVGHTLRVLADPVLIQREREHLETAGDIALYEEYYFRSQIVGRLVETKFHDNAFFMVDGITPAESRLVAEDALDRIWSILPYPALAAIGMARAKYVTLYSVGDLLANLRLGVELGSLRTGSMFAQGLAIFGIWAPLLYFVLCLPVFVVWDALSRPGRAGAQAAVSVIGMLLVYRLFAYGIVTESVGNIAGVLLRFQLQNVLVFALVFAATRAIWPPFDPAPQEAA